mmetsp:Transcript_30420/g.97268  ORF Transcript_30420/g.97268 Transcript_30420/m.97268 type:complete len:169 (-) Transcript_30420:20-526(-)
MEVKGARHCAFKECRREDFLPFQCDACHGYYCLQHWTYAGHACTEAAGKDCRVILCPLCGNSVRLVHGEDVQVTFNRHKGSADCVKKVKRKCPVAGCRQTLGISSTFTCTRCGQDVCLNHRYEESHNCQPVVNKNPIIVSTPNTGAQAAKPKKGFFGCLCGGKPKVRD